MRKSFIFIIILGVMAFGNAGILVAGDVESQKQYGLAQWTWKGKGQTPERSAKERHGLNRWTWEERVREEPRATSEEHGLGRWTRTDRGEDSRRSIL